MNEGRPRVLIVSYTPTAREPRIIKQIAQFRQTYHVTTAGYGPAPEGVDEHIELVFPPERSGIARVPGIFSLLLLVRMHGTYAAIEPRDRSAYQQLRGGSWDVVVAHDAQTLDLAMRLKPRYGVLADMHEYAPKQSLESWRWRLLDGPYFTWICRTYLPEMAAITTVSSGIVDEYRRVFGVHPTLVVNATPYQDMPVGEVGNPIRLVHSGGLAPQRRLDIMIRGVRESKANVTLDLFLVDDGTGLMDQLKDIAGDDERIRFKDPVPYDQLVRTLNQYDVGLSIFPPTTFNLAWCLPNKFFDYVQARIGVLVGPSPEMSRIVEQYGFGTVLPDFEPSSLAATLEGLAPDQVAHWKSVTSAHVHELSGEEQGKVWGRVVATMLAAEGR